MSLAEYKSDHFSHEIHGDITVVKVAQEKLSEEQNLEEFGEQLFAYVEQYDCNQIALDCSQVVYASSSAIGKLITLHRKLKRVEGSLVVCGLQTSFTEILQTARLHSYFTIVDTVADAVAMLSGETE
ncbi:MAG: STAS domain-containing protein [Planctomycetaceae bacterium]